VTFVDRLEFKDILKKKSSDYINICTKLYMAKQKILIEGNKANPDENKMKKNEKELRWVLNKQIRTRKALRKLIQ
jgi:hypothetical protein